MEHLGIKDLSLLLFFTIFSLGTVRYFLDKRKEPMGYEDERLGYPMFMLAFFFIITPMAVWQSVKWLWTASSFIKFLLCVFFPFAWVVYFYQRYKNGETKKKVKRTDSVSFTEILRK